MAHGKLENGTHHLKMATDKLENDDQC